MSLIVWGRRCEAPWHLLLLLLLRESVNEAGGWSDGRDSDSPLGFQAINNIETATLAVLFSSPLFPSSSSSSLFYSLCTLHICFHLISLSLTSPLLPSPDPRTSTPLISPACSCAHPFLYTVSSEEVMHRPCN